ncbi:Centromere protein W [Neolecta irregularis DAH-3]|uniref:Centromere protein W n=1 Tax=Neolecta irregularis (strain DAH-3) TaxID=1198029 RepID=A0A1U7LQA8_NEOID|nr:Centromere protein W [Neolecta irregularis DAH-3]|eukprot:OLL24856.1 Centromere protein W [Neolecta irregularis DAH-3]
MAKIYPRSTLKRIVKAHRPKHKIGRNVDTLMFLDLTVFMSKLIKESKLQMRESGEKSLRAIHVEKATERALAEMHG